MPAWMITVAGAILVAVLMVATGVDEGVKIFVLIFGWFLILGLLLLGVETLFQKAAVRLRRFSPRGIHRVLERRG